MNAAETVKCRKCQRPLTSASSLALGIGPRCAAIEAATEGLNAKQVDKMTQVIEDGAVVPTNRKQVWNIVNEAGEVVHIAHLSGSCTCAWGLRRDSADIKTCYHVAAARLLARPVIRKTAPAPAPIAVELTDAELWARIDQWNDAFMAMA